MKKGMTPYIRDLIKEYKFDFMCVQETIQKDFPEFYMRKIDPTLSYLWHWIPARGRSGGIITGINIERFDVGAFHDGKYMCQLDLWDRKIDKKWNLINIYGTAQMEDKIEFLSELAAFCSKNTVPFIVGGDFNLMRDASEKNKVFLHNKHTDLFNTIINANSLREIRISGGKYTWSNNQMNPTLEVLDRVLMSREWELLFPTVTLQKKPREISDHNPLIMNTDSQAPKKFLSFHFELSWLKQPDFYEKVKKIWDEPTRDHDALGRFLFKMKKFKKFFKGWGFNQAGINKKRKKEIQDRLMEIEIEEENRILTNLEIMERMHLQTELLNILDIEELYWFKRSHETWLLKGDRNTEFYHRVANGRKRKKYYFLFTEWG